MIWYQIVQTFLYLGLLFIDELEETQVFLMLLLEYSSNYLYE